MRFCWTNLETRLLKQLGEGLNIQGDPAQGLSNRFGSRPNELFIKETWSILLESWLCYNPSCCNELASSLREAGIGDSTIGSDLEYLKSCRNAKTLRQEALRLFLLAGKEKRISHEDPKDLAKQDVIPDSTGFSSVEATQKSEEHLAFGERPTQNPTAMASSPSQPLNTNSTKRFTPKVIAIGLSSAAVLAVVVSGIIARKQYDATVELGQDRHVKRLLALSESPGTAAANLQQLETFRRSNWRFYLTRGSLDALNRKGIALHRSIEVESIRQTILRLVGTAIPESDLDSAYSRFTRYRNLPAFAWLDTSTTQLLQKKVDDLSSRREMVAKRKAEEVRKAKELAEAAEQRRREEEAQRAAAEAEAQRAAAEAEQARQQSYSSDSGQSGYIRGPRGGCYYLSGGSKVYVDRSNCN